MPSFSSSVSRLYVVGSQEGDCSAAWCRVTVASSDLPQVLSRHWCGEEAVIMLYVKESVAGVGLLPIG